MDQNSFSLKANKNSTKKKVSRTNHKDAQIAEELEKLKTIVAETSAEIEDN